MSVVVGRVVEGRRREGGGGERRWRAEGVGERWRGCWREGGREGRGEAAGSADCLHLAIWPLAQSCPSVKPHPFRSWEHSTASEPPTEGTLATAPPGSIDPRSSMDEGALPTFRSTRQVTRWVTTDGMDRPVLVALRCT